MSKRAAALASIQAYLADPTKGAQPKDDLGAIPDAAAPHAAPGTQAPTVKAQREQIALERDQVNLERDQLKLEQEQQKSALEEKTDQAAARLQQVVNYSKFRLEGLSMPGGLFLPIAVLFIFFLALLPIGGNTRLQWLWSVVTGNAELSQMDMISPSGDIGSNPGLTSPGSPGSPGTPGGSGPTQVVNPAPPPTSGTGLIPFTTAMFTGVEQAE